MVRYQIKSMSSYIVFALVLLGLLAINFHKSQNLYTVELQRKPTILNFAGFANPILTYKVSSPIDGVVSSLIAQYGDAVKKGDLLFVLQSNKLETDFRAAVETYVKAKSTYQGSVFKFNGNQELFKLGLISKLAFTDSENELKSNELALWDAELQMKKNMDLTGLQYAELQSVSMENLEKMQSIMAKAFRGIKIKASNTGIMLFPSKTLGSSTDGDSSGGPVGVGSQVKEGQALAVIADMTGLIIQITVNETNFKNVFDGQKAKVTGPAFGNIELEGKVIDINNQANSADFNSTPTYTVFVSVPKINKEQKKFIQVGMSTQVSLIKDNPPIISIPLNALIQDQGKYSVRLLNKNTHEIVDTPIVPGETDVDSVQVLKGLQEGDQIVLPD